ncbi:ADP-ribosylation factor-related protein 1-like [Lingula anatina]|uniref:ADP-ribosylation factor-related protein 1 n=1 Tax=Lingula anatina TaxID=7574 RepID=A0A1S3KAI2_LINAN|nr:ADP-ribosylation factor-related protein 1-like [Lingula anatina]|eukprot:XP_013419271.1 ADP-ribosylation factor-related protein 1-like [Lingula anatina]
MFTLLSGLYKYMCQKDEYFVVILGLDNAGKTTYLEKTQTVFNKNYKGVNLNKITTTVGLNIGKIDVKSVRLNFWDLGGQEELQSLWDKYYAECHAVIYMVDGADRGRIVESKQTFDKMITSSALDSVPLLVVVNKQDLEECMSVAEVKEVFNTSAHKIGRRSCHLLGASALNGEGIDEGIHWVVTAVEANSQRRPPTEKEIR